MHKLIIKENFRIAWLYVVRLKWMLLACGFIGYLLLDVLYPILIINHMAAYNYIVDIIMLGLTTYIFSRKYPVISIKPAIVLILNSSEKIYDFLAIKFIGIIVKSIILSFILTVIKMDIDCKSIINLSFFLITVHLLAWIKYNTVEIYKYIFIIFVYIFLIINVLVPININMYISIILLVMSIVWSMNIRIIWDKFYEDCIFIYNNIIIMLTGTTDEILAYTYTTANLNVHKGLINFESPYMGNKVSLVVKQLISIKRHLKYNVLSIALMLLLSLIIDDSLMNIKSMLISVILANVLDICIRPVYALRIKMSNGLILPYITKDICLYGAVIPFGTMILMLIFFLGVGGLTFIESIIILLITIGVYLMQIIYPKWYKPIKTIIPFIYIFIVLNI